MANANAVGGLKWVKDEIAISLQRARKSLEAFAGEEGGGGGEDLAEAVAALQEVRGVLISLQLSGPARLVEEMQQHCLALGEGRIANTWESSEAWMLALIQLPDYLDRIESGHADVPAWLLPAINDLRAVREDGLLSEAELLVPTSVLSDSEMPSAEARKALWKIVRQIRPHFHRYLLQCFTPATSREGLRNLGRLFHQLQIYIKEGVFHELFLAVEALVEAMLDGSIEINAESKALIGHLDRVIKPFSESWGAWPEAHAQALLVDVMSRIATCESSSYLVTELQQAYGLHNDEDASGMGRIDVGASPEAIGVLIAEARSELMPVKDALDLYARGSRKDRSRLAELEAVVRNLANTLLVTGVDELVGQLRHCADAIGVMVRDESAANDNQLMAVAEGLLDVDTSLSALGGTRMARGEVGESEHALLSSTIQEANVEIAKAEQAISALAESPNDLRPLQEVPGLFRRVSGALRLLSENDAADVLDGAVEQIRLRFLASGRMPVRGELELLAQSISAIEFYMDGLRDGQSYAADLIGDARRALTDLAEFKLEHLDVVDVVAPSDDVAIELAEPKESVWAKEIDASETQAPPQSSLPQVLASSPKPAPTTTEAEDIDQEFLEIFLEEAREEQDVVREQFARWRQNERDDTAMTTLRRSFHTLKGSGRLVGAERTGDFAWAFENLLNKVIDETVQISPTLFACLADAVEVLPDLIDAEADGRVIDVADFIERADRLASGEQIQVDSKALEPEEVPSGSVIPWPPADRTVETDRIAQESPETESATSEEMARSEAAELAALVDMDEELLGLFRGESEEHIDVLKVFRSNAARGDAVPDESVVRALHTLTGSARMTGVDSVAAVTSILESLFRDYQARGGTPSLSALDLLERVVEKLELRVSRLPGGGDEVVALLRLAAEAKLLDSGTEVETSTQPAEVALDEISAELLDEIDREDLQPAVLGELGEGDVHEFDGLLPAQEIEHVLSPQAAGLGEPQPEDAAALKKQFNVAGAPEPEAIEPVLAISLADSEQISQEAPAPASLVAASIETPGVETFEALPDDFELLGLFLEDARDLLDKLDQSFRQFQLDPTAATPIEELKRLLHTLKGSARLSGLTSIGDLCHAFESLLTGVAQGSARVGDDALELSQRTLDTLGDQVDAVEQRKPVRRAAALIAGLSQVLEAGRAGPSADEPDVAVMVRSTPSMLAPKPSVDRGRAVAEEKAGALDSAAAAEPAVQIRVRADLLNQLVDNAGEISIYGSRLVQQNNVLGFRLEDLDQTVRRLRGQLRKLEIETEAQIIHRFERESDAVDAGRVDFDPLEMDRFSTIQQLSRSLAETVNDLVSIRTMLSDLQGESETLLVQQDRVSHDLQNGLLRTRMVPFAQVVPRLHRVVRQTAQQLGKRATLEVMGADVELDRSIQERIVAPLEHLLRNAIAHGIELPDWRMSANKSPVGVIRLSIRREGNDAVISVEDDGAGLNIPAVRAMAVERGLIQSDAEGSDDEVSQLIMESGFTTAKEVSQIAGRGVGMDVVNTEIKQLSGNLSLESKTGKGTRFSIRLPLTLAIVQAMLVQVSDEIYAIPHATMEAVARISREDLQLNLSGKRKDFHYAGHDYRVSYLGAMLKAGENPVIGERSWQPILLARAGDQRVAFHIDSLLGSERVVVKPLGPALSSIRWLTGGTILPDGRVAMILDLLGLIRSGLVRGHESTELGDAAEPEATEDSRRTCVMIVDDSLTVRRVTSRMLQRQDIDVLAARDGVDALAQLEDQIPNLILLDIEMPRMDGYELTRHIRRSPRLKDIPIIMITSRTGEKHRKYAMEVGVDRYLGKPYQEAELLDEISSVLLESGS